MSRSWSKSLAVSCGGMGTPSCGRLKSGCERSELAAEPLRAQHSLEPAHLVFEIEDQRRGVEADTEVALQPACIERALQVAAVEAPLLREVARLTRFDDA